MSSQECTLASHFPDMRGWPCQPLPALVRADNGPIRKVLPVLDVLGGAATPATDAAAPQYEDAEEEDAEQEGDGVYVKYDQVLHGSRRQSTKGAKTLVTRKFLKKFIHYAHARTPRMSDEVRRACSLTGGQGDSMYSDSHDPNPGPTLLSPGAEVARENEAGQGLLCATCSWGLNQDSCPGCSDCLVRRLQQRRWLRHTQRCGHRACRPPLR